MIIVNHVQLRLQDKKNGEDDSWIPRILLCWRKTEGANMGLGVWRRGSLPSGHVNLNIHFTLWSRFTTKYSRKPGGVS